MSDPLPGDDVRVLNDAGDVLYEGELIADHGNWAEVMGPAGPVDPSGLRQVDADNVEKIGQEWTRDKLLNELERTSNSARFDAISERL